MAKVKAPRFPTERTTKPEAALRKAKSIKALPPPPTGSGVVEFMTGVPPPNSVNAPNLGPVDVLLSGFGLFPKASRKLLRAYAGVNASRSAFTPGTRLRGGAVNPNRLQPWTMPQKNMIREFADAFPTTGAHVSRYLPLVGPSSRELAGQARMTRLLAALQQGQRPRDLDEARRFLASIHLDPSLTNNEFARTIQHEGNHVAQGIVNPWLRRPVSIEELLAQRAELPRMSRPGWGGMREHLYLDSAENGYGGINAFDPTIARVEDMVDFLDQYRAHSLTLGRKR